jgi:ATP:ADP antiporter, AAA family
MNATTARPPRPARGPLDRMLSIFGEVRDGEGLTALLLMLDAFLLLAAYYIIKPLREALILGGAGAEIKSYSAAAQSLLLLAIVPAYGRLGSRVDRVRLITWVTLIFMSNLAVFYALGVAGVPSLGIPFFLWVGIFNVMIVAQFWAYANDVYTPEQGQRLFAIVAIGSSLGAIAGAWVAKPLIDRTGVYTPMLVALALLGASIVLARAVHARARVARGERGRALDEQAPLERAGGFRLVFSDRYLLLIAALVLLMNAVNTTGEYLLGKTVAAEAERVLGAAATDPAKEQWIGLFYADFFFWVNLIGAAAQMFLVSRLMSRIGVRAALFVLPVIALGGYGLMALAPVLAIIRGVKIAENATDYSLNNTVRHALFLPTSREAKYKAKAAIDGFFWRMGDLVSAGLVFVGTRLELGVQRFAAVNLGFVLVWLVLVVAIGREHRRLTGESADAERIGGRAESTAAARP